MSQKRGVRSYKKINVSKLSNEQAEKKSRLLEKRREDLIHKFPNLQKETRSFGQRFADKIATVGGSWGFIMGFFIFLAIWMIMNALVYINHWDPYPFILLNLVLSCLAAVQAPIILMSQNRSAERDRKNAHYDYMVNRKAERENIMILEDLKDIKEILKKKR